MNEQSKLIKEIINDMYLDFSDLESRQLNYELQNCYLHGNTDLEIENLDNSILDAIEAFNFISSRNKKILVKLNSLLEENEKDKRVIDLENQMKEIQVKKIITVKEFSKIYGYSAEWQKLRRGRIHNSLPYRQLSEGRKITYSVEEVENWFINENKRD